MITPIEQLRSISGEAHGLPSLERTYLGEQSIFGAIFQSAIRNVKETNADWKMAPKMLCSYFCCTKISQGSNDGERFCY